MVSIVGIVLFAALLAVVQTPKMWRNKNVKQLVWYGVLLLIGTGLCIVTVLRINVPSPLKAIEVVLKPVHDSVMQLLK